ncbi:MAG: NAD(P)H-hydrate dehydratase [Phycisphaerales bacterium]|nr:NAD(P)H-hydrate dehydratase [Phycisphaerales bacterium]
MSRTDAPPKLPPRDPRGHKGTFGTVAVVGGCAHDDARMIGAVALVATGALRAGCGLARVVTPAPILAAVIGLCPSATGVPMPVDRAGHIQAHEAVAAVDRQVESCSVLVIGPGMGRGDGVRAAALRAVQQELVLAVVDADAINALADVPELTRDFRAASVLTPHPGEYARLAAALRLDHDPVDEATRPAAAEALAQRLGCIVVLKGSRTVVSDGQRTWVNTTGSAALATAGTGDVLAGVIAGVAAQFVAPPHTPSTPGRPLEFFDAARIAVAAHGLAAELWAGRHNAAAGLMAMELASEIPAALERLR